MKGIKYAFKGHTQKKGQNSNRKKKGVTSLLEKTIKINQMMIAGVEGRSTFNIQQHKLKGMSPYNFQLNIWHQVENACGQSWPCILIYKRNISAHTSDKCLGFATEFNPT